MKRVIIGFFLFQTTLFAQTSGADLASVRDSLISYAYRFLGVPYQWGGSSDKGFDCTGFVHYVFKQFGIEVSRASSGYEDKGSEVSIIDAQPGDIMLFTGTNETVRKVGHAGIVCKNEDGVIDFIHSSSSTKHCGVVVTRYNKSGYESRFLRIINVLT